MRVLKPRNRLVYFRVSEEEFNRFSKICEAAGARSISDLARVAVQHLIHEPVAKSQADEVVEKLRVLETGMSDLSKRVQELTTMIIGAREAESRGRLFGPAGDLR